MKNGEGSLSFGFWVLFILMCVFCLHVNMCSMCMPGACIGQKRAFHPLELELQIIVHHHEGAGKQIQVLCKSNVLLLPTESFPQPYFC